jgi:ATP-dependent helicase/nuclease subunit B
LLRQLDGHHDALRRVFTRYGIPFFLDRREPVAHHPLAELTRCALRTAAFDWRQEDWFGALKTGLSGADETDVDWLENAALEHGWEGQSWQQPLAAPGDESLTREAERLRGKLVPPFLELAGQLAGPVSGAQLAAALRGLWSALQVDQRLTEWSATAISQARFSAANPVHQTVWDQMQRWLEDLERAFPGEAGALPLREWLPILEAGLSGLTVGVIPPALDQVLVGTVDRSRNPELKLALVLGLNEGIFPAPPAPGVLLTDVERAELERQNVSLGPTSLRRLGHERYYGYIACTRARARLVLTCAAANARGQPLNPSPFFCPMERLFPGL